MLETKCFDDNFKMLVTILAVVVTNILYLFNISVGHQHSKDVTKIEILLPISKNCHQHYCHHRHVATDTTRRPETGRNGTKRSLQTILAIQGPCITDRSTFLVPNCIRVSKDFENFSKNVRRMYNFESFKKILKLV